MHDASMSDLQLSHFVQQIAHVSTVRRDFHAQPKCYGLSSRKLDHATFAAFNCAQVRKAAARFQTRYVAICFRLSILPQHKERHG